MEQEPGRIPSVGCLLYLAADQVITQVPSLALFKMTRVPCKRVWVHPIRLSAMVLTATFLRLQEDGQLSFRVHEMPVRIRIFPGGQQTESALIVSVLDATPQPGLAGVLLTAAIDAPDGRVGALVGIPGRMHGDKEGYVLNLAVAYPYIRRAVRTELLETGFYVKTHGAIRPDCTQIASLAPACADAVSWWKQQQATEAQLCTMLLEICRSASTP